MPNCGVNCEETLREVERFLDGELEEGAQVDIQVHLSNCHPCMERTEFRKHLKALVHDKCAERKLPDGLGDRIRDLIATYEASDG